MTEHNAPDISVRPVRMAKSRAEKAKFIEIAPGKHIEASVSMRKLENVSCACARWPAQTTA